MALWCTGVTGAFGEEAVDMTLLASKMLGPRRALATTATIAVGKSRVMSLVGRDGSGST